MISKTFLSCPEENEICQAAITNVTKFMNYVPCGSSDMIRLLSIISQLFSSLNPQNTLYAIILAMFKCTATKENSKVAQIAFIIFLPTIYIAICAIHNIPPYSTDVLDSDIISIFQVLRLISTTSFSSLEMLAYLCDISQLPGNFSPESFILRISTLIQQNFAKENVKKAISILTETAVNSNNLTYLDAIFDVLTSILEISDEPQLESGSFSTIASIAAQRMSKQAEQYLQVFLVKLPQTEAPKKISKKSKLSSKDIIQKLKDITSAPILPDGETELKEPILPIPLINTLWNKEEVMKIRNKLQNVKVQPFTKNNEEIQNIEKYTIDKMSAVNEITIPTDANDYIAFETYMH
ncbi:hypothetical protein GPJ56_000743 [Histomonas meleagridis]|uniref:uncharacterized protein n=1 Tax=Histomonas meleagridis TaxID=135588 RepID=UPI003559F8CE|nr:hypothetical protein GPJ56_000743 [Histomonas meleagridis]KAH0804498.1 hypothetical protein GO595_003328 [Histomonas meleagridis]